MSSGQFRRTLTGNSMKGADVHTAQRAHETKSRPLEAVRTAPVVSAGLPLAPDDGGLHMVGNRKGPTTGSKHRFQ
eukprot:15438437-Alexandrium_andersonii.AAC.1